MLRQSNSAPVALIARVSISSGGQPKIEERNGGGRDGSQSMPRWKDISPTVISSAPEAIAPTSQNLTEVEPVIYSSLIYRSNIDTRFSSINGVLGDHRRQAHWKCRGKNVLASKGVGGHART